MARRPKPADIGHNSGGPSKGDVLSADAELLEATRESKEAAARLGAVKKRWKKAGVNIKAVTDLQKQRNQDENTRVAEEAEKRRYAGWMNVRLVAPTEDAGQPEEQEATSTEEAAHREAMAKDAGYRCGRLGTDRTSSNTFPPGSPLHVAFDLGWLDGQAKIAAEMGPDVQVADSSKKKPKLSEATETVGQG